MSGRRQRDPSVGVFVSRDTIAIRCETSVDTLMQWERDGFLPRPAIERGQIKRWHWPTVEAALLSSRDERDDANDPYMTGINRAKAVARRVA